MNVEPRIWVQTLTLKPGDIVLVRLDSPDGMNPRDLQKFLTECKRTLRGALDEAGHKDTQLLVCAKNVDISVIPAVDLLGVLSSGVSADPEGA